MYLVIVLVGTSAMLVLIFGLAMRSSRQKA
jgi:hypothetical protein